MSTLTPINYRGRIDKIREAMARENFTAVIVTRAASIYYTSGCYFLPFRPGAAVIIPLEGDVEIVARAVDYGRLPYETWIPKIRPWVGWATNAYPETTLEQAILDALRAEKSTRGKIGFELGMEQEPGRVAPGTYDAILPEATLADATHILDRIMMRKEREEILLLQEAAAIADAGVAAAVEAIRPGVRETEVAGHAELAMRRAGANWFMGQTIVASGFRSAYAFAGEPCASEKLIQLGDIVHLDCSPVYRLYLGDLIAMVAVGEPTKEQAALAKAVDDITEEYLTLFRPGAVVAELDQFAREAKKRAGYGEYDCWINGHGMGCPPRTPPYFTPKDKTVLEPDMVVELIVQVHPPKVGGMAHEFAVHITDGDPVPLNRTPRRLLTVDV
jgi:Xaa-Pro aminopeptidase